MGYPVTGGSLDYRAITYHNGDGTGRVMYDVFEDPAEQQVSVLHELGHALIGGAGRFELYHYDEEMQAYSVAQGLLRFLGGNADSYILWACSQLPWWGRSFYFPEDIIRRRLEELFVRCETAHSCGSGKVCQAEAQGRTRGAVLTLRSALLLQRSTLTSTDLYLS